MTIKQQLIIVDKNLTHNEVTPLSMRLNNGFFCYS